MSDTPTTELRAFVVSCCDHEKSEVVYARTRSNARQQGPDCGCCRFIDRSVRRAPKYDAKPPTQRQLVADGWWFNCIAIGCHTERITEESFTDGTAVEDEHGNVFCSPQCRDAAHAEMAKFIASMGTP